MDSVLRDMVRDGYVDRRRYPSRRKGEALGIEVSTVEMSKNLLENRIDTLVIVGNGFDLWQGLPTSYYAF